MAWKNEYNISVIRYNSKWQPITSPLESTKYNVANKSWYIDKYSRYVRFIEHFK